MIEIMEIIISTFRENKAAGSYALFYLLALGLGLAVAWDRYGKTEMEDNWMVEEAKKKINSKVDIYYEGLALIPTDWRTEVLTYEFKGRVGENDFIVYVNAETGREEKIFMIINTPNGILTV